VNAIAPRNPKPSVFQRCWTYPMGQLN
jgi:hypothetical protein